VGVVVAAHWRTKQMGFCSRSCYMYYYYLRSVKERPGAVYVYIILICTAVLHVVHFVNIITIYEYIITRMHCRTGM
jgi:hypothetical protein